MLKPLRDIILIRADKPKEKTASGLYVIEEWKTLPATGEVLAVGPLVIDVAVGDHVQFERYASVILENDERLCQESHVLGVLNG
jgi:co-chaperonin GroES (HSP10)